MGHELDRHTPGAERNAPSANVAEFLDPIAPGAPAGSDLRQLAGDLTFERLREMRTEISPHEDWAAGLGKDPDWPAIVAECQDALRKRTKDLELANALTEAWTRTQGFAGLAHGLLLVRELLERFWDCVHPGFEDGQVLAPLRARHLSWLGGADACLQSVRQAPLLRDQDRSVSWAQRVEALRLEDLRLTSLEAFRESKERGALELAELDAQLDAVPSSRFAESLRQVEACREELLRLTECCHRFFHEPEAPDLLRLRDLLDEIAEFLKTRVQDDVPPPTSHPERPADAPTLLGQDAPAPSTNGAIRTRDDALQRLAEIAEFLRRTEPHSPVSYLVERAVRWGRQPLERVLREVVKDPSVLNQVWDTLGITPPED